MFLLTGKGIIEIKQSSFFKRLRCEHDLVTGEKCSSLGMTRISGKDTATACTKCGKITNESTYNYY